MLTWLAASVRVPPSHPKYGLFWLQKSKMVRAKILLRLKSRVEYLASGDDSDVIDMHIKFPTKQLCYMII